MICILTYHISSGCNVETANDGCTQCAERTAIVKAISEGYMRPGELEIVLVATRTSKPTAPCGSCRQVIEAFAHGGTEVWLSLQPGRVERKFPHKEPFPHSFDPNNQEPLG